MKKEIPTTLEMLLIDAKGHSAFHNGQTVYVMAFTNRFGQAVTTICYPSYSLTGGLWEHEQCGIVYNTVGLWIIRKRQPLPSPSNTSNE